MELRYCEKCGDIIKLEGKDERINPAEHFVCPRCSDGDEGKQRSAKDSFDGILDQTSLNLFSPSTLALKRKEMEKIAVEGQKEPGAPPREGSSAGSSSPARTARKLQFRCLHCRSTLMIRPVDKPSRMVCPKCKGNLFIDQTGIVSKRPPAVRAPQEAGPAPTLPAQPRGAPASAQKERPSAAVPRTGPKPPQAPPAAPPIPEAGKAGSGGSTKVLMPPTALAKPGSVRRMPSSIQRTFPPSPDRPGSFERPPREPARPAEAPLPASLREIPPEVAPGRTKSAVKLKKEADRLREPEGFEKRDLFRGLSITPRAAVPGEEASRSEKSAEVLLAVEDKAIQNFDDLEAEFAQVEDLTKPLTECMSPAENIVPALPLRSAPVAEELGWLKGTGVLLLILLLAILVSAPLYLAGHLSLESGAPSRTTLSSGSQRPAFEKLGTIVERGKKAILSLPARWTGRDRERRPSR